MTAETPDTTKGAPTRKVGQPVLPEHTSAPKRPETTRTPGRAALPGEAAHTAPRNSDTIRQVGRVVLPHKQ